MDEAIIREAEEEGILFDGRFFRKGRMPGGGKRVLFLPYLTDKATAEALYVSALEAALSGYEVISIAEKGGSSSIIAACLDAESPLHLFIASGIKEFMESYPQQLRRIMLSGGSIISAGLCSGDADAARDGLLSSGQIAVAVASAENPLIQSAIDMNLDLYILRASLTSAYMKRLYREGCPVISSFSAIQERPGCIVYQEDGGPYGFLGKEFSAVYAD